MDVILCLCKLILSNSSSTAIHRCGVLRVWSVFLGGILLLSLLIYKLLGSMCSERPMLVRNLPEATEKKYLKSSGKSSDCPQILYQLFWLMISPTKWILPLTGRDHKQWGKILFGWGLSPAWPPLFPPTGLWQGQHALVLFVAVEVWLHAEWHWTLCGGSTVVLLLLQAIVKSLGG